MITAGEAGFRLRLREQRDWEAQVAAMQEAERQRCVAAAEAKRAARLSDHAAALRTADDIRTLVARARASVDQIENGAAFDRWCAWALGRADRLDPLVSGALVSDYGLDGGGGTELPPGIDLVRHKVASQAAARTRHIHPVQVAHVSKTAPTNLAD